VKAEIELNTKVVLPCVLSGIYSPNVGDAFDIGSEGRFVNCEPSPIKDEAETSPLALIVPDDVIFPSISNDPVT